VAAVAGLSTVALFPAAGGSKTRGIEPGIAFHSSRR